MQVDMPEAQLDEVGIKNTLNNPISFTHFAYSIARTLGCKYQS